MRVNRNILVGKVVADPVVSYTRTRKLVVDFAMEIDDQVEVDLRAWENVGERIAKGVKRGDLLYVEAKFTVEGPLKVTFVCIADGRNV